MYDICIIGAGPSGSSLARLVGKEYKILLLERRDLDKPKGDDRLSKCCGGLIASDAQKMLARISLGIPKKVLVEPQIFLVRTIDFDQGLEVYYQRHYINVDREGFDRWLFSLIPGSVDVRTGCFFRSFTREKNCFRITFTRKSRRFTEDVRLLVGADGAGSRLRRLATPNKPFPKTYTAIQEWFECDQPLPYYSVIFDRSLTDFYAWTIPKGNLLIIGGAFYPKTEISFRVNLLKEKLKRFGYQIGNYVKRTAGPLLRTTRTNQIYTGRSGIAFIGEAAGWISPSSAEGLSYAFRSAVLLADVLRRGPENFAERYRNQSRKLKLNILLKNIKSHFIYNQWLRRLIMLSRIRSIELFPISKRS